LSLLVSLSALLLAQSASAQAAGDTRLEACLAQAGSDPEAALKTASEWLPAANVTDRSLVQQCLGVAYTNLARWEDAELAFLTARDARPVADAAWRARLGTMAANAALASGRNTEALAYLQEAEADAALAEEPEFGGSIAQDRARALVALERLDEAGAALAEARQLAPDDPQGWLLSATLARRQEDLAQAQGFILEASRLAPDDPAIALEAGLISALGGDDAAARSAWERLIASAPQTPQADTAREYLAQLNAASDG